MSISATATVPGTESADQIGIATLESLARAARQVALYGPLHPIAEASLTQACRDLESAAGGGLLEIRARADGLLWNGTPLGTRTGNARRFHAGMRDRLICAIEIQPTVRPRELARLLMVMAQDAEAVAAEGGALASFEPGGTSTIRVHEFDFTAEMLVPEATWRQLCEGVDPAEAGNLRRLIASCAEGLSGGAKGGAGQGSALFLPSELDQQKGTAEEVVASGIAQLVQRAGEALYFIDQEKWRQWRDETVRQIAALPPRWKSLIFRVPSGYSLEYPDMLGLIAGEMEPFDCVSLVLDHADSIQAERSDMLRLALERILATRERRDAIEAALHERAVEQGVPEAVYQNVVGLIVSRMEGKQPSEPEAASLQPKMAVSERPLEAAKRDVADLLRTTDPEAVRRSRLLLLQEAIGTYLTISQYGTVISLLTKAVEECAALDDLDGLIDVLGTLGGEAAGNSGQSPSRRAVAASALTRASTDQTVACLQSGMEGASPKEAREIIALLGLLGEPGMRALVEILRTGEESRLKLAMRVLLESDGPDYSHIRDLVGQAGGITLERALRSLIEAIGEQDTRRIEAALADSSEEARERVVKLIVEMGREDLGEVLRRSLADSSGAVRLAAVTAIAELGVGQAAAALCELIGQEANYGEGSRLKEAAVRALGALREEAAVPTLCGVLRGGAFLSRLGSFRPRVAAAEALATLGGPESLDALRKGSRSMHPAVREACRRALTRLEAGARAARAGING